MLKVMQYRLRIIDKESILMPKGAKILSVKMVQGKPCVFVLADIEQEEKEERVFRLYDTNRAFDAGSIKNDGYIGTISLDDGELNYHVFEGVD